LSGSRTAIATPSAYLPIIASVRTGPHQLLFGVRGVAVFCAISGDSETTAVPLLLPGAFIGDDFAIRSSQHLVPEVDAYCSVGGFGCLITGAVGIWFP